MECCIPNHRSFNLVTAALDGVSVTNVVFKPSVKSLVSLCGRARCICLCILLNVVYVADAKAKYLP